LPISSNPLGSAGPAGRPSPTYLIDVDQRIEARELTALHSEVILLGPAAGGNTLTIVGDTTALRGFVLMNAGAGLATIAFEGTDLTIEVKAGDYGYLWV